jgi:hypothetical protein
MSKKIPDLDSNEYLSSLDGPGFLTITVPTGAELISYTNSIRRYSVNIALTRALCPRLT